MSLPSSTSNLSALIFSTYFWIKRSTSTLFFKWWHWPTTKKLSPSTFLAHNLKSNTAEFFISSLWALSLSSSNHFTTMTLPCGCNSFLKRFFYAFPTKIYVWVISVFYYTQIPSYTLNNVSWYLFQLLYSPQYCCYLVVCMPLECNLKRGWFSCKYIALKTKNQIFNLIFYFCSKTQIRAFFFPVKN